MAVISELRVKNYASIHDSGWIPIEETFTTMLGPNGAGKSNFLNAITEFGRRDPIPDHKLCKYSSAPSRKKSTLPIISIKFTYLGIGEAPYVSPPLLSSDLNSPVTHREIEDAEGSPDINSDLAISENITPGEATITRYADGTHKLHLDDQRRIPLDQLISQRASELEAIGKALAEQDRLESAPLAIDTVGDENTLSDLQSISNQLSSPDQNSFYSGGETGGLTLDDITEDIQDVTSVLSELQNPAFDPLEKLPDIFENTEIELVDGSIKIEDIGNSTPYRGFLDAGGLSPGDISNLQRDVVHDRIEDAESRLSDLLNGYLTLDPSGTKSKSKVAAENDEGEFEIIASLSREQLELNIEDETSVPFKAHQRSTGIRWLLGFLLTVIHGVGDDDDPGLVVLDDPGVHLHPEAKELLLASLETLTSRKQVIYSTHSPFLIDNSRISNTRIVEREGTDGSTFYNAPHHASSDIDMDSFAPIRDSLGATLATLPFGSGENIIVEGPTDRQYLNEFTRFFNSVEYGPKMDDNIAFIDGSGGKIPYMAQFLEAEGIGYEILLDDKESGLKEGIINAGIEESKIHYLSDTLSYEPEFEIEIEDCLPESIFHEVVLDSQKQNIEQIALEEVKERDTRIIHFFDAQLSKITRGNYTLEKEGLADEACSRIRRCIRDDSHIDAEELDDMMELLTYLDSLFA